MLNCVVIFLFLVLIQCLFDVQIWCPIAKLRGATVVVRYVKKDKIRIDRALLVEMRQVLDERQTMTSPSWFIISKLQYCSILTSRATVL